MREFEFVCASLVFLVFLGLEEDEVLVCLLGEMRKEGNGTEKKAAGCAA